ncbi:MAG: NifU-like protein [Verrucomicrobia bacterium ADurb.Bin006]|mgnify:FL=1|jgi:nitrogen fixation NifU-like protein|nr:MAG: NifU-like protein [Verrucomicrobia bacterium ADurb.Bin006]
MMDDLNDLYQQVILDHSRSPRNFRALPDANRTAQGHNPLCGDNVTLYLRCEGDVIREITFQGSGCAISKASASILTECLQGRTKQEVEALFERVRAMLTTGQAGGDDLGKLSIFAGVHKFPARVKCAILSWHAVLAALEGKSDPVSTEEGGA